MRKSVSWVWSTMSPCRKHCKRWLLVELGESLALIETCIVLRIPLLFLAIAIQPWGKRRRNTSILSVRNWAQRKSSVARVILLNESYKWRPPSLRMDHQRSGTHTSLILARNTWNADLDGTGRKFTNCWCLSMNWIRWWNTISIPLPTLTCAMHWTIFELK